MRMISILKILGAVLHLKSSVLYVTAWRQKGNRRLLLFVCVSENRRIIEVRRVKEVFLCANEACRVSKERIDKKDLNAPEHTRHSILVASDFVIYLLSFCAARILISLFRRIPKILFDEFVLEIFWSVLVHRLCICYSSLSITKAVVTIFAWEFLLHNIIKKHGTGFAKFNWESDWNMICADAHILRT